MRTTIQPNLVEFWMAILAGPGRFLDSACAFLADVVQVSSQKTGHKIHGKIQPNLVEFWIAILAGPRRFLDSACALRGSRTFSLRIACLLLADVVQVSSQKSAFRMKCAQQFNQIWLNFGWQFWRVQGAFTCTPPACRLHADCMQLQPLRRCWPQHIPLFS